MVVFRTLFNMCNSIMSISLYIFGYTFNLWQVCIFSFVVSVLGWFVFKLLR